MIWGFKFSSVKQNKYYKALNLTIPKVNEIFKDRG